MAASNGDNSNNNNSSTKRSSVTTVDVAPPIPKTEEDLLWEQEQGQATNATPGGIKKPKTNNANFLSDEEKRRRGYIALGLLGGVIVVAIVIAVAVSVGGRGGGDSGGSSSESNHSHTTGVTPTVAPTTTPSPVSRPSGPCPGCHYVKIDFDFRGSSFPYGTSQTKQRLLARHCPFWACNYEISSISWVEYRGDFELASEYWILRFDGSGQFGDFASIQSAPSADCERRTQSPLSSSISSLPLTMTDSTLKVRLTTSSTVGKSVCSTNYVRFSVTVRMTQLGPAPTPQPTVAPTPSPVSVAPTPSPVSERPSGLPTPPPAPFCGDNAIGGDEFCDGTDVPQVTTCFDEGFVPGVGDIGCQSDCSAIDTSRCDYAGDNLSGWSGQFVNRDVVNLDYAVTQLRFEMFGGSGDADLYVNFGTYATLSTYDCRPYTIANNESCVFDNPTQGEYHFMVFAFDSFSGVSLRVTADLE